MKTIRGFEIKKRKGMNHWSGLLEEWLLTIERYCRIMQGGDAPFIYTERALVGTLAAASWRCGRVALEEFQCQKGFRNKPKTNGRADLYMATEAHEEIVEAKFKWLSLASDNFVGTAQGQLDYAVTDAKKSQWGASDILAIGVAFIPVYLASEKELELEEEISSAISIISTQTEHHAAAWCFPSEYRRVLSEKNNFCPGIIMLAANSEYY